MNRISTLLKAGHVAAASLVFGLVSAGSQASPSVDHALEYKAMSMKDDLASGGPRSAWRSKAKCTSMYRTPRAPCAMS
jgi:hypothetical protein